MAYVGTCVVVVGLSERGCRLDIDARDPKPLLPPFAFSAGICVTFVQSHFMRSFIGSSMNACSGRAVPCCCLQNCLPCVDMSHSDCNLFSVVVHIMLVVTIIYFELGVVCLLIPTVCVLFHDGEIVGYIAYARWGSVKLNV
jgi:hypothetical protein